MGFSFADLGFWRLALVTLIFELLHGILDTRWPGIRGSHLGPRPLTAVLYMGMEALSLFATLAAAIGTTGNLMKLSPRPAGQIICVVIAAVALGGFFFY